MKRYLEAELEDDFEFAVFERLDATKSAIADNPGKILYVPTDIPVPFDKRVLSAIVGDEDVRVLSMPTDRQEFREQVYAAIEHLVATAGETAAVFFCPRDVVDTFDEIPGSAFVDFQRVTIEDSALTVRETFERGAGQELSQHTVSNLAEFSLRLFSAAATGAELDPGTIQGSTDDRIDEFYLPFDQLDRVSPLIREFYLAQLGVANKDLLDQLPREAQHNVYTARIFDTYGPRFAEHEPRYDEINTVRFLDADVLRVYRRLVITWLSHRTFDTDLEDVAERAVDRPVDREFNQKLQQSYQRLFGQDDRINIQEPDDAAARLADYFGILFKDIEDGEFSELVAVARDRFSINSQQVLEYSPDRSIETVEKVDRFLRHLSEVALINDTRFVNNTLSANRWQQVFEPFIHAALDQDRTDLLTYRFVTALNQARQAVRRELEHEEQAEQIRQLNTNLENLPVFLEHWCEFITDLRAGEDVSDLLRQELLEKYDRFSDELVARYDDIVDDDDWVHISNLLEPQDTDGLRVIVVVDSFGYTDYELLQQFGFLDIEPDDAELVVSNIPSYTPSAMSTVLTGLPAEQTGIYSWQTRIGESVYNLRENGFTDDDFSFVDETSNNSFQLIQRPQLNQSGITKFSGAVSDMRISSTGSIPSDDIDEVPGAFAEELEAVLEEQNRIRTSDELPQAARDALKSDIVLYIEDFDQYLHQTLAFAEFENYYRVLGSFLEELLTEIRDAAAVLDESPEIVVTSDHGKLTRFEMDQILDDRSDYEFDHEMLTDAVSLDEAYAANFRRAEFTNRSARQWLKIAAGGTELPIDQVRTLLQEDNVDEDEIREIIETIPYLLSGSKFMFGWTDDDLTAAQRELEHLSGVDVHLPDSDGIFDVPDIGITSRYNIKNRSGHDHGYHGGTSLSEMGALRLTFHE